MRVLLFDIDGTLLMTNGGGSGAIQHAIKQEFGLSTACTNVDFAGRTDRSLLNEILQRNRLPETTNHFSRLRERYVDLFPGILEDRGGRLLPGALEVLRTLQGHANLACYVMTGNLTETAQHKLAYFGLDHFFDDIFGGEHDSDRDDLARRTAKEITERHGQEATGNMIVIGDTPADVRCGHAIGADVLAVCSGRHSREELEAENPMVVHEDLSNVEEVVRILTQTEI